MLLRQATLADIETGEIDQVYRWWASPRVREGTKLRTSIGLVEVLEVEELSQGLASAQLDERAAERAGFDSLESLLDDLRRYAPAEAGSSRRLFCIELRFAGADPRTALRQRGELAEDEAAALAARVRGMGKRSADGPWGMKVLESIARRPETLAAKLASELDMPVRLFKPRVRQLKELGLTESLTVGYRLSPRGAALLAYLAEND